MGSWAGAAPMAGDTGLAGGAMAASSQATTGMAGEGVAQAMAQGGSWYTELLHGMRKVAGFFGYLTSIWSFACLVEVSAVLASAIWKLADNDRPSY